MITILDRRALLRSLTTLAVVVSMRPAAGHAERQIVQVDNSSELARALSSATAGTTIVLADGNYERRDGFALNARGSSGVPIVVRAAYPGRARLNGTFSINGGAYVCIWGLNFEGPTAGLQITGEHHKVIGCRFAEFGSSANFTHNAAVTLPSRTDSLEIAYCLFEKPANFAPWYSVERDGAWPQFRFGIRGRHEADRAPYGLHIHHCHFRDFPPKPSPNYRSAQADAIEIAPIGSAFDTHNLIEYCMFENINDDSGAICDIKAGSAGIFQYNTALNCAGRIDLRSATNWTIRHNWLENTQGIAVYGRDHQLIDNQLSGGASLVRLLRGNGDDSFSGAARPQVVNCLVRCHGGTLRIGTDWSADSLDYLPVDIWVENHRGAVEIQTGATVLENHDYPCGASRAFKLAADQIGPAAAPAIR
jgi:hypothetical protein